MDYQGNTRKEREKKEVPEKNIEKVVVGEVIQKPKGVGRKFKDIFLGGDAKQAARYVGTDVLIPALRNLIWDAISKGAEKMIFGESRYGRRTTVNYGTSRYQAFNNPISRPYDVPSRSPFPIALPSRVRENRHDMNDVVLSTREEAELVIERLHDILENYDAASLADLYDLLGLPTSHIDNKWGWKNLQGSEVRQIRQGFLLELPPLEEI